MSCETFCILPIWEGEALSLNDLRICPPPLMVTESLELLDRMADLVLSFHLFFNDQWWKSLRIKESWPTESQQSPGKKDLLPHMSMVFRYISHIQWQEENQVNSSSSLLESWNFFPSYNGLWCHHCTIDQWLWQAYIQLTGQSSTTMEAFTHTSPAWIIGATGVVLLPILLSSYQGYGEVRLSWFMVKHEKE